MRLLRVLPVLSVGLLSACATIVSGTSQRLAVDSVPEGADCRVAQGGVPVAEVAATPGAVLIHRGPGGIAITCTKPGYPTAQQVQGPGIEGWVFGNLVIGGLVGVVVDVATGAVYHYSPSMTVALGQRGYAPALAGAASGTAYANTTALRVANDERFEAATGSPLPARHGLVRLAPATPSGDATYIWPSASAD